MATRRELVEAIQKRYQHARLAKKTAILDEFIEVTGTTGNMPSGFLGQMESGEIRSYDPRNASMAMRFKKH